MTLERSPKGWSLTRRVVHHSAEDVSGVEPSTVTERTLPAVQLVQDDPEGVDITLL